MQKKVWMLRAISPHLFDEITARLEEDNIHLNDIQANAIKRDDGLDVMVQFGDNFTQSESQFFTYEQIDNRDEAIREFAAIIAESCQEVMIADYFKMMKP